jgi:hypothetical protein
MLYHDCIWIPCVISPLTQSVIFLLVNDLKEHAAYINWEIEVFLLNIFFLLFLKVLIYYQSNFNPQKIELE